LPSDIPNHASYIQSWIAVLKQDRREFFHAAADAQKIADYILSFHPDYAQTPQEPTDETDEVAPVGDPLAA
jgi:antirestriction protein ArdC